MQGARKRLEREDVDRRDLALQIAYLSRCERLPSAQEYLSIGADPLQPQSPDTLEAMGRALASAWGAEDIT